MSQNPHFPTTTGHMDTLKKQEMIPEKNPYLLHKRSLEKTKGG